MYTPGSFEFSNDADKIAFMKRYSFATVITNKKGLPIATHLPLVVEESHGKILLSGHFAKANEQAHLIASNISLVIFSEPHAYISPQHYNKRESVPTWDYIAVHAYGTCRILEQQEEKMMALEKMINNYEPAYQLQWQGLPEKFKHGMLNGIVAFEITVTELQAQQKLSQNKSKEERERIIQQLEKSSNGTEKDLAAYIKNL